MGSYQKFRGNPEQKLFFLLGNFLGGINTEFSDDNSNDTDFESIINFDMDKLGTLTKRSGFGELSAISEIFNKLDVDTELPNIKNRTPNQPNPEVENDNVVYMKLLRNDNKCFRALSGFSGEKAYRKYQEMYGFQNNQFELLMITTKFNDSTLTTGESSAWLYKCKLPELEYDEHGEPTATETVVVTCNKITLPVMFNWDRNLTNIDTIEFYDKIYFTDNNDCLVSFDRSVNVTDNTSFANAFKYHGLVAQGQTNSAYKPSGLEVRHIGFNVLATDPLHFIDDQGISTDSIQGVYISTTNNIPLQALPLGQKFLLNIIYTGTDNGFTVEMKEGENTLSFDMLANSTLSRAGLKVYEITFKSTPNKEVEIKITKTGATLEPYYDYYNVEKIDSEAKPVQRLNVGDYGLTEMYNRAVFYKDDTIWFSEVNNFSYIPNYNYVTLPIEPTDKITKIAYFKKSYIIFTKQRIYKMVNAFGSSNFQVTPVNLSLGCHAGNTVLPVEDTLYFASTRGLYALKSNTFLEGYENLKELDIKVKKLTSDFTKYDEELTNPAVRFNGINERAYAIRYKDKYLLFYNNYNDKGDYAAENDLDVLAYQFDLGSYTTYRFQEKPTFLFTVDNAIETLATVAQKEVLTDEKVLFDYDLSTSTDGKIIDQSESGNDAIIRGKGKIDEGIGVNFGEDPSYIKLNSFNGDIEQGFTIRMDTKLTELTGSYLVNFKQSQATVKSVTGSISTSKVDGYSARFDYTILPNILTGNDTVSYKLSLMRDTGTESNVKLYYGLNTYVQSPMITLNFGTKTEMVVSSGTFKITRDRNFNFSELWVLAIDMQYTVTTTTTSQVLGADVNLTNKFYATKLSWIKLGFSSFTATATSTGCTITYTPAVKHTGRLNIGERKLYVTIDGTEYTHTVGKINADSGTKKANSNTISLAYQGSKTITVSIRFNIKATLSGTYTANVSTKDTQNIALPSVTITTNTVTTTKIRNLRGSKQITLTRAIPSTRDIILRQVGNKDQLEFYLSSENGNFSIATPEGIGLLERHLWSVDVGKTSSGYTCTIYRDSQALVSKTLGNGIIINVARTYCAIGTANMDLTSSGPFMKGDLYGFSISNPSTTLLDYTFSEGEGTKTLDISGNNIPANFYGDITWIIAEGFVFNGEDTYLELPPFPDTTFFSNGFKIEFEGIINSTSNISRIIDLATSYNNDTSSNKKCSINIGVKDKTIAFNTTSASFISYRLEDSTIDFTERHSYIINCVNNNGRSYTLSLTVDDVLISSIDFNYGGISDINRNSNFIGRSNTTTEKLFKGILNSFKFTVYASQSGISLYRSALYEFDTTSTDFGRPMYIELKTKGINMKYPQHLKKLKHIFVKAIGGYSYGELFFLLYGDGYVVNDPEIYTYYVDELTGTIIQEYKEVKNLTIDERLSILGNMRLDYTKLGEGMYQTRKLIIPKKARNFTLFIYGESSDYLSIENFGFVCKLGKVKEG